MFKKIADRVKHPTWAVAGSRWRRLTELDLLLDGKFYDHLPKAFYDEQEPNSKTLIPIEDRRPSAQYRLPRMAARTCARKLWSGRHAPRIRHKDQGMIDAVTQMIESAEFFDTMLEATVLGSVGAVAVVFCIDEDGTDSRVSLLTYRARFCTPRFDRLRNLTSLRVHYTALGASLSALGIPGVDNPGGEYWFVRDYTDQEEITYAAIPVGEWNPVSGFSSDDGAFIEHEVIPHGLGFVPAVWIRNMRGNTPIDGCCTWEDAIPNSIEIDYLLSQASRGTRYNCAPQLVVIGNISGDGDDELTRGPQAVIQIDGGHKDPSGETIPPGDAKLLEMQGMGVKTALDLFYQLRNTALEQIGVTRKDPDKMKGVLSGRAMEFLDEESLDLYMELRNSYGRGALQLLRKICAALGVPGDASGLSWYWPRFYPPTPEDIAHLVPALVQAATPIIEPTSPTQGTPSGATGGGTGAPKAPVGKSLGAIMEVSEAKMLLRVSLDLDLLTDDTDAPSSSSDEPISTKPDPTPRRMVSENGDPSTTVPAEPPAELD